MVGQKPQREVSTVAHTSPRTQPSPNHVPHHVCCCWLSGCCAVRGWCRVALCCSHACCTILPVLFFRGSLCVCVCVCVFVVLCCAVLCCMCACVVPPTLLYLPRSRSWSRRAATVVSRCSVLSCGAWTDCRRWLFSGVGRDVACEVSQWCSGVSMYGVSAFRVGWVSSPCTLVPSYLPGWVVSW